MVNKAEPIKRRLEQAINDDPEKFRSVACTLNSGSRVNPESLVTRL
jgi:hypothetical protein